MKFGWKEIILLVLFLIFLIIVIYSIKKDQRLLSPNLGSVENNANVFPRGCTAQPPNNRCSVRGYTYCDGQTKCTCDGSFWRLSTCSSGTICVSGLNGGCRTNQ